MPQAAEQRPLDDLGGGEPSFKRVHRTEIGLPGRQPHCRAMRLLVILAPWQKQRDAVLVTGQRGDIETGQFGGPQCRGETDQDQGPIAMTGQSVGDRLQGGAQWFEDEGGLFAQWPAMGAADAGEGGRYQWRGGRRRIAGEKMKVTQGGMAQPQGVDRETLAR